MLLNLLGTANWKPFLPLLLLAALVAAGCDNTPEEVSSASSGYEAAGADEADAAGESTSPPAATPPPGASSPAGISGDGTDAPPPPTFPETETAAESQTDIFQVPDGTAEELFDYLDHLSAYQPPVTSQDEMVAAMVQIWQAEAEASQKLLEKELTEEQRDRAVGLRMESLRMLSLLEQEGASTQLEEFIDSLAASDDPAEVQQAELARYQITLDKLLNPESADAAAVMERLTTILEEMEPTEEVFYALRLTPSMLRQGGFSDEAAQASQMLGDTFAASSNPAVAKAAAQLLINAELSNVLENHDQAAAEHLVELAAQVLEGGKPEISDLQSMVQLGQGLEFSGYFEEAGQIYQLLADLLAQYPDIDRNGALEQLFTSSLERIESSQAMLGQPLELEGQLVDGSPFDWSQYQGKVVLVDFWATWCPPCLAAMPHLQELYTEHEEEGFEIVGMNVDEDLQDVEQYLSQNPLPWATVYAGSLEDPNVERYHVDALPFTILVDRQGNVAAIHIRGEQLDSEIERLLALAYEPPVEGSEGATPEEEAPATSSLPAAGTQWFISYTDEESPEEEPAAEGEAQPAAEAESDSSPEADQPGGLDVFDTTINPYLPPPGLSQLEILDYILDMSGRPESIQEREGFNAGLVEACNQLLAENPQGKAWRIATSTRLTYLHRDSCRGVAEAQERLMQLTDELAANLAEDTPQELADQVALYQIEARALGANDLPADQLPQLLGDLEAYMNGHELGETHLRLASQTVHAVNLLPEEDREPYFQKFGAIWSESEETQLARYGRRIGRIVPQPESFPQIGETIELAGVTAQGTPFDLASKQGEVVVVDFWATWCGPCLAEMPNLEALYEEYQQQGLVVVGVSLDEDLADLGAFLLEHPLPWPTLAGDECQQAAERYEVHGIPTMMLIDRQGKIVAIAHGVEPLREQLVELLAAPAEDESP